MSDGRSHLFRNYLLLWCTSAIALPPEVIAQATDSQLPTSSRGITPRYEFNVNADEFALLHAAAQTAVGKYGGDASFRVKIAKTHDGVLWAVRIDDPRLIEAWTYWMAEKTAEIVNVVNVDALSDEAKLLLRTARSVNARLVASKAHPIWDQTTVAGRVVASSENFLLDDGVRRHRLVAPSADSVRPWVNKYVVATGFVKAVGHLEAVQIIEQRKNTLEIAVMSHCPFARRAENLVFQSARPTSGTNGQAATQPAEPPTIELRYLFTQKKDGDNTVYSALHGEPEVQENLVQMILRDRFPEYFRDYVMKRAASEAPWEELAIAVQIDTGEIAQIRDAIIAERDELIAAEVNYLRSRYGEIQASPTFIWESQRVDDVSKLPGLQQLLAAGEQCR